MEGLTSPAKEVSTGSGSSIHPSAWKMNSAKFAEGLYPPCAFRLHEHARLAHLRAGAR
jgi:hypothetical protein